MPGTDPVAAAEIALGELSLPALPELPARGLGSDMVGRAAAVLVDLPMDVAPSGYRLTARPGGTARRARDLLNRDLDAVQQVWERSGRTPGDGMFKVAIIGPFTLAASVELPGGHKVLHDRGAWQDVVESLSEGIAILVAEVAERLGVAVIAQIDEPLLGRVVEGTITPLTRLDIIRPIAAPVVAQHLSSLAARVAVPVILHDCGSPRWDVLAMIPDIAVSTDLSVQMLSTAQIDGIGAHIDAGRVLVAGIVPALAPPDRPRADHFLRRLTALGDQIGVPRNALAEQIVISPSCGLAGAGSWAAEALRISERVAQSLVADAGGV